MMATAAMDVVETGRSDVDATEKQTRELNDRLRELLLSGAGSVRIRNVCGQRYIGTRLYTPQHLKMNIEIFGTPGNDLGAFLYGTCTNKRLNQQRPFGQLQRNRIDQIVLATCPFQESSGLF